MLLFCKFFFFFWNLSDRCGLGSTGRIIKRSHNSKLSFLASLKIWCGEGRGFLEQRAIKSGLINNAFSRQQLDTVRQIYMHYACKRNLYLMFMINCLFNIKLYVVYMTRKYCFSVSSLTGKISSTTISYL